MLTLASFVAPAFIAFIPPHRSILLDHPQDDYWMKMGLKFDEAGLRNRHSCATKITTLPGPFDYSLDSPDEFHARPKNLPLRPDNT